MQMGDLSEDYVRKIVWARSGRVDEDAVVYRLVWGRSRCNEVRVLGYDPIHHLPDPLFQMLQHTIHPSDCLRLTSVIVGDGSWSSCLTGATWNPESGLGPFRRGNFASSSHLSLLLSSSYISVLRVFFSQSLSTRAMTQPLKLLGSPPGPRAMKER